MADIDLMERLAEIQAYRATLPREELAKLLEAERKAQRESFIRAMAPCEHGDPDWETCPDCLADIFAAPAIDERAL